MKPAEHRRRGDVDPAPRLDSLAEIYRLELIVSRQQSPAAFEITRAGIGQRNRPRRPIEEAGLSPLLARRDCPGDGCRPSAQMARGFGKALLLRYCGEDRQGVEAVLHAVAQTEIEKRGFAQFSCMPRHLPSAP